MVVVLRGGLVGLPLLGLLFGRAGAVGEGVLFGFLVGLSVGLGFRVGATVVFAGLPLLGPFGDFPFGGGDFLGGLFFGGRGLRRPSASK